MKVLERFEVCFICGAKYNPVNGPCPECSMAKEEVNKDEDLICPNCRTPLPNHSARCPNCDEILV